MMKAQIKIEANFRLWQAAKKNYYASRVNSWDETILIFFMIPVFMILILYEK